MCNSPEMDLSAAWRESPKIHMLLLELYDASVYRVNKKARKTHHICSPHSRSPFPTVKSLGLHPPQARQDGQGKGERRFNWPARDHDTLHLFAANY
jgi:hypothetical protein